MLKTALIFISLLLASCATSTPQLEYEVSQQQLLNLQQNSDNFLLVDVRSVDEFNQAHIPGAINIPHTELTDNMERMSEFKSKDIIVYCRSGRRAGIAIAELKQLGFAKLHHLTGDMNAWTDSNLATKSIGNNK